MVAVATKIQIAHATAAEFGMTPYSNFDELLADKAVDIVAINTPLLAMERSAWLP